MIGRKIETLDEAAEILGTDPSWVPRILAVLKRDNPKALNDALSAAVWENACRALREQAIGVDG